MSDEKAFREERLKKTDAMLVTFLRKAKGAPRTVLEAWGISPPSEEPTRTCPVGQRSARATQLGVRKPVGRRGDPLATGMKPS